MQPVVVEGEKMIVLPLSQTGDPWHDWGLCELYVAVCEAADAGADIAVMSLTEAGFTICSDLAPEDLGNTLHAILTRADRWNRLHPRFEEGKKLARCQPNLVNGRRIPGEKYEPKVGKEEWEAEGCRGNPPQQARNRCQRLASITLTPKQLEALMAPDGGPGSFKEIAANAFCPSVTADVTQGADPLVAKHHSNGKVRGPSNSNTAREEDARYLLPCFCATVSPWKPFVKDDDCTVFLPDNVPFTRALRLLHHFCRCGALIDPDSDRGDMYRNLPLRADGEEAQLLVLLDALQDRLAVRDQGDGLFAEEIVTLNDWLAVHFSSGTNVNVGAIHRIEVPGEVFPLLKPIKPPAYWKNQTDVAFVPDCLTGLRVEDVPIQSHIARALFMIHRNMNESWRLLGVVSFTLYKNTDRAGMTNRAAAALFPHFYRHFARELLIMTEDQLEACRKIGELTGSAFHRDVTMLSRLHNTSSPGDLHANLELVTFRLFKATTGEPENSLWHISPEEFQIVLDLSNSEEWQAAAQTISTFACLKAFNQNLGEGSKKP
jgi:hypothetical protein